MQPNTEAQSTSLSAKNPQEWVKRALQGGNGVRRQTNESTSKDMTCVSRDVMCTDAQIFCILPMTQHCTQHSANRNNRSLGTIMSSSFDWHYVLQHVDKHACHMSSVQVWCEQANKGLTKMCCMHTHVQVLQCYSRQCKVMLSRDRVLLSFQNITACCLWF